ADEDIEAIKWLRTSGEMTSCKHGKHVFISIWWGRKVLKMRKKINKRKASPPTPLQGEGSDMSSNYTV
ncbi:MAG: hypothetical protein ACFN4W_05125, partial [Segatella oris]